jgi:hypothetical protein
MTQRNRADADSPYCSITDFCRLFGGGRTSAYRLIAAGRIRAVKRGTRTLIDLQSAHNYFASLPLAEIKPEKPKAVKVSGAPAA